MNSNWKSFVLAFALSLFVGYKGFIHFYPNLLFLGAKQKIGGAENSFKHAKLPDEFSRFVVKPNPDFLYSSCFYNLNNGPLLVEAAALPTSYWSLALYAPNTVNFYVKNNVVSKTAKLKLFLAQREEDRSCMPSGAEFLRPKEAKGVLLFRFLVTDTSESSFPKIKQAQKSLHLRPISCDPYLINKGINR